MNIITTILANKHTSGSALAFAVVKVGSRIAATWFPAHKAEIDTTSDALEGLAVLYMGASAGDAVKSATKEEVNTVKDAVVTGDTSMLSKSDLPPTPPTDTPKP